jgi:hypothetical protein
MNKKSIIITVAVLCVVVVGALGFTLGKGIIIKSNPVNYLLYSATQNNHTAYDATLKASLSVDEATLTDSLSFFSAEPEAMAKFVTSLVDQISFSGDIVMKTNMDQKELFLTEALSINYADQPLIDFGIGLTQEQIAIESKTFYDKSFTMSKAELFQMIKDESGVDLSELHFNKYIDLFDMEKDPLFKALVKDYKGYETILRDALVNLEKGDKVSVLLSNGKEIKCDELQVSMTMDELLKLYVDLLSEAKTDENLKALLKSKTIEVLNLVISSEDYKILQIEKSEVEAAIVEIDTNFDTEWNKAMDEMIATYQDAQYQLSQSMVDIGTYNIKVAIDSKYNIRQLSYAMDMMGFNMVQTVTYNAYDNDVVTKPLSQPENSIAIMDMMKDEDLASEIGNDMVDQGLTNIIEGEALNLLMSDLKTYSEILPADERDSILSLVDYFFENKDLLKDMILSNTGL